jgi:hypothetical protein
MSKGSFAVGIEIEKTLQQNLISKSVPHNTGRF